MMMCLDIGNTHIFGGVFKDDSLRVKFRYPTQMPCTSDQLGLFLKNVLRENDIDPEKITAICLGSVVPSFDYSVIAACKKYFNLTPLELKVGVKTGLRISLKNPIELGADRIANTMAAIHYFPNKDIILIDFGTATTICAISKDKEYLGGAIMPGIKLSMNALHQNAAKLAPVDIVTPESALGTTTQHNIQAGLYYSQLGAVKEFITQLSQHPFTDSKPVVLATGGYTHLFSQENIFDLVAPDLTLHGLRLVWEKNTAQV